MEHWKFINARFSDQNRTIINITWQDGDNEVEETIPFDENYYRFQELLKHISVDELHDQTKNFNRENEVAFKEYVKAIAEEDGYLYIDNPNGYSAIFDKVNNYFFNDGSNEDPDKELLFKLKLTAFELDFVKTFKGRSLKSELRKATSIYEIYSILFKIKDEISN